MNIRQQTLDAATRNIGRLRSAIDRVKATDANRLRDEYNRLVSGLQARTCCVRAAPNQQALVSVLKLSGVQNVCCQTAAARGS